MQKPRTTASMLACVLALAACASNPPSVRTVDLQCPTPPEPSATAMQPRQPTFLQRLQSLFEISQPKPTR